jgi:hypothetical protein
VACFAAILAAAKWSATLRYRRGPEPTQREIVRHRHFRLEPRLHHTANRESSSQYTYFHTATLKLRNSTGHGMSVNERYGRFVSDLTSRAGGPAFKSWPGNRLSWLGIVPFFLNPTYRCQVGAFNCTAIAPIHIMSYALFTNFSSIPRCIV